MRKRSTARGHSYLVVTGVTRAEDPECITSDTLDYCAKLAQKMDALGKRAAACPCATGWQGQAMCEHGQIRAGLARLRRAMIIVHSGGRPVGSRPGQAAVTNP